MSTTTPTSGGTLTSFSKTPQAGDDSFRWTEDELAGSLFAIDGRQNVVRLDVMSNDLGGKAKKLFSIDDGLGDGGQTFLQELLQNNVSTGWESTSKGEIRIVGGVIQYSIDNALAAYGGTIEGLGRNHVITDEFKYAIQLGNGTLS